MKFIIQSTLTTTGKRIQTHNRTLQVVGCSWWTASVPCAIVKAHPAATVQSERFHLSKVLESTPPLSLPRSLAATCRSHCLRRGRTLLTAEEEKKSFGAPGTRTDRVYEWGIRLAYCELVTVTVEPFRLELDWDDVHHMRNRKRGKHILGGWLAHLVCCDVQCMISQKCPKVHVWMLVL